MSSTPKKHFKPNLSGENPRRFKKNDCSQSSVDINYILGFITRHAKFIL